MKTKVNNDYTIQQPELVSPKPHTHTCDDEGIYALASPLLSNPIKKNVKFDAKNGKKRQVGELQS